MAKGLPTSPSTRPFREAARSVARLYDIAAAPEMRDRMTFPSPKTGGPVLRAFQIPRNHADLRAPTIL
jgi:4-hydroxyphenylacetate 3-monooxygenase